MFQKLSLVNDGGIKETNAKPIVEPTKIINRPKTRTIKIFSNHFSCFAYSIILSFFIFTDLL